MRKKSQVKFGSSNKNNFLNLIIISAYFDFETTVHKKLANISEFST